MLKHILLSISALVLMAIGLQLSAQTVHFSEDFTNGIPAGWTINDVDGNTPHPNWPQSRLGQCTNYPLINGWEGYCGTAMSISWYSPAGQSDDWLFTPAITIPNGVNNVFVRWTASNITTNRNSNFADDYAVRIATTTNIADHVPNLIHNGVNPGFEEPIIDISQWAGQTIYISFQNYESNGYALLIDNLEVVTLPDYDVTAGDIITSIYSVSPVTFTSTFTNSGASTVNSVEVNYQIGNGNVETATVSGLNIAPFQTEEISFPTPFTGTGVQNGLKFWVTKVNGNNDATPGDNEATLNRFTVAATGDKRKPIIETFTSSTCGPCLPGNIALEQTLSNFRAANTDEVISIKHQQNFPSVGDPYCTDETQARRNYYGITSIPQSTVDGYLEIDPRSLTTQNLQDHVNAPGFGTFVGQLQIDAPTQTMYISGSYTSNVDFLGVESLQLALVERRTDNNVKSNNETEFFNVVKKMLPSQNGTSLGSLTTGQSYTFDQVYTFRGNYRLPNNAGDRINPNIEHSVEEFSDLYLVAWVENQAERFILNAGSIDGWAVGIDNELGNGSLTVSPNPASDFARLDLNLTEAASANVEVVNELGQVVLTQKPGLLPAGENSIELNVTGLATGLYHVSVITEKGIMTRPMMIVR